MPYGLWLRVATTYIYIYYRVLKVRQMVAFTPITHLRGNCADAPGYMSWLHFNALSSMQAATTCGGCQPKTS